MPDGAARPGPSAPLAAVVLSGGRGSRLGGVSKASLEVAGVALLDGVLAALRRAGVNHIVVVGEAPRVAAAGIVVTREKPPFAGPLAALGAGVARLGADANGSSGPSPCEVLVLACDLPRAADLVELLVQLSGPAAEAAHRDGTVLVDAVGHEQWLAARYRLAPLRAALAATAAASDTGTLTGLPLRTALRRLTLRRHPDTGGASRDIDTPADLAAARRSAPPAG